MYCYWCYWGWPKPVSDIYNDALRALGGDHFALEFGPTHSVWGDENFGNESIEFCFNELKVEKELDARTMHILRLSLFRLKELPIELRTPPEGHRNGHPEDYPPPFETVKGN